MQPLVKVITLNYNQNDYTLDCVKSLLQSEYSNFEILLIENGSTPENYTELLGNTPQDERLKIIRLEHNIGYVGGVNHGITIAKESQPDHFIIMNNDTLIDPTAIASLVDCSEKHNRQAIVSGKVYNYDGTETLQYIGNVREDGANKFDLKAVIKNKREEDEGQYDKEMQMDMLDDILWLIPDKIIDKVGLYSPYFFLYGEQTDYALRAVAHGYKLIYTPLAKIWHKGGITTTGGDKTSPKLLYWLTFATLKVVDLHSAPLESNKFIKSWVPKRRLKLIYEVVRRSKSKVHYTAFNTAVKHFKTWREVKYFDNGYNPF